MVTLGSCSRKRPLCFSNKVPFHSEVGGGSKRPVACHWDTHWKCRCYLAAGKGFFASKALEQAGSSSQEC